MSNQQNHNRQDNEASKTPGFNIGNASNPAPDDDRTTPSPGSQLLDENAEKYLREAASIEDLPDAQDQQEMDDTINESKKAE